MKKKAIKVESLLYMPKKKIKKYQRLMRKLTKMKSWKLYKKLVPNWTLMKTTLTPKLLHMFNKQKIESKILQGRKK